MRAVLCTEFAPLERLQLVDRDSAPCPAGSVRIAVSAAGVNFVDGLIVQGKYQLRPKLPFIPGGEVAGTVAEIGGESSTTHPAGTRGLAVGDRVFASVGLAGGFASEAVVDARNVLLTPDAMTDGQAATFMQSYMTARFALRERAQAVEGQWMLVLGAGGGVGLGAVDVGRAMGLQVIAAASTPAKRKEAQRHGAQHVIDSSTEDVKARAKEIAAGSGADGVDLVYDPVGGTAGEQTLRALRENGQFLVIGFASGQIPQLPANQVLLRNRRVTGVDWGGWAVKQPEANRRLVQSLVDDIAAGRLHPVEPSARPMAEVADALRDQLERRITGKSVLVPG